MVHVWMSPRRKHLTSYGTSVGSVKQEPEEISCSSCLFQGSLIYPESGAMAENLAESQRQFLQFWDMQMQMVQGLSAINKVDKTDHLAKLLASTPATQERQTLAKRVLLEQTAVARKTKQDSWLKVMAKKLAELPFFKDREWVSGNIHPLKGPTLRPSGMPTGPCTDVRRRMEPNLPRTGEHLEMLDAADEVDLLQRKAEEDREVEMEIDRADRETAAVEKLLAEMQTPPSSLLRVKPVSPVKPFVKAPQQTEGAPSQDTIAKKAPQPTERVSENPTEMQRDSRQTESSLYEKYDCPQDDKTYAGPSQSRGSQRGGGVSGSSK